MAIDPGDLDQRIVITQEVRTPDAGGGAVVAWQTLATVWAAVWPVRGQETEQGGAQIGVALYRFRIRRRGDLSPAMRITWQGREFNIRTAADPGPREFYMVIEAETGVAV